MQISVYYRRLVFRYALLLPLEQTVLAKEDGRGVGVAQAGFGAFFSPSVAAFFGASAGVIHLCLSFACEPYSGLLLHFGHNSVFSPLMF
jgi:hypothetical protein